MLIDGYGGLRATVGTELGVSPWLDIQQERIDAFADTTGDHAWIHVDPGRAAEGPYGRTIAHGLLTLSVLTMLAGQVFRVTGLTSALHYGYDRVRFIRPVVVGSRIRARVTLTGVRGEPAGTRAEYHVEVDVAGTERPACAADLVYFYTFAA
jgi:acyl dehydratase